MEQISYEKRICSDNDKIEHFLISERVGVIGMAGNEYPYAVPVNYLYFDKSIYFHGMGSGKKNDLFMKNPSVCFTVFKEIGTVTDPVPCHADTSYMSVILYGKVRKVSDPKIGAKVMGKLVEKYMPGYYQQKISDELIQKYRSSMDGNGVSIYQIEIEEITAKENKVEQQELF